MSLNFAITGDNSNLLQAFDGAKKGVHSFTKDVESAGLDIENMFKRVGLAAGAAFGVAGVQGFVKKMFEVRSYFQDIESSMKVFLGDEQKAVEFTKDLKDYAWFNMFEFSDLADASKQLIAYGNDVEKISGKGGILDRLSNIATATKQPLMDLVNLWNKAKNSGNVDANAMLSWASKGLVLKDVLAEIGETVHGNSISFEQLQMAIAHVTDEGGMFAGLMDEMMPNLSASWGQLQDDIANMFDTIGEAMQGPMKAGIELTSKLVNNYEAIGTTLAALVGVYGTYKTAVLAVNLVENASIKIKKLHREVSLLNAIAVNTETGAKGKATVATLLLTKAQAALNATMLANPYVLAASALAAIAATFFVLSKNAKNAAKATEELNDSLKELKDLNEEQKSISALCDEYDTLSQKAELSADETSRLLVVTQQLAGYLPTAIKNYDEFGNALDINTDEVRKELAERKAEAVAVAKARKEEAEKQLEALKAQREEARNIYKTGQVGYYKPGVNENGITGDPVKAYRQASEEEMNDAAVRASVLTSQINETEKAISNHNKTISGYFDDLSEFSNKLNGLSVDKLTEIKEALDAQIASGEKGVLTVGDFFSYDFSDKSDEFIADALKNLVTKLPQKGTNRRDTVGEKIRSEEYRLKEMLKSTGRELEDVYKERQSKITDAEIAAMEEGYDKQRALRDKENKDEIDDIEKQREKEIRSYIDSQRKIFDQREKIKKDKDPLYEVKFFDESTVDTSEIAAQYDRLIELTKARQVRDEQQESLDAMREFLKEYGTIEEQRLAITEEYDRKIASEVNEHKRQMLEAEKTTTLSNLNAKAMAANIDWSEVFSGLGNVLGDVAKETLEKVRDYMKSEEYLALDPADRKVYKDLVAQLTEATGEKSSPFNPSTWSNLSSLTERYKASVAAHIAAQGQQKTAMENLKKAEEELANATDDSSRAAAEMSVSLAQAAVDVTTNKVNETASDMDEANQDLHDSANAATKGLDEFSSTLGQITSGTLSGFATGVYNLVNQISGNGKKFANTLADIGGKAGGLVGAILAILDALGDDPSKFIEDILNHVADVIEAIIADIPKIVLSAVKGVGNIVTGIFSGLGKLLLNSEDFDIAKILNGSTDAFDNATKKWGWLLDTWKDNLAYEKELMEEAYGTGVIDMRDKGIEALKQTQEAIRETAKANALSGAGIFSRSNGYKENDKANWEALRSKNPELAEIINRDAMNLFGLDTETLKKLKHDNSEFWQSLSEETREYLDQYIETAEAIEELQEAAQQQLTQTTFDSVEDEFLSTLMDMESESQDFADNFEEMLKKAVMSSMMLEKYKGRLKDWYDEFATLASDGELSKDDKDYLNEKYMAIAKDAINERDLLADTLDLASGSYSQKASAKGFQAMSQDTGDELNGRFTALQIAGEGINVQVASIYAQMSAMASVQLTNSSYLSEIRNIVIAANSHLEDISRYTRRIFNEFGIKLDEIGSSISKI